MADLRAVADRFYGDVLTDGKLEVIDEITDPEFVERQQVPPGIEPNREGLKQFVTMFRSAFPDLKATVVASAAEGDELWVQAEVTGTHQGELGGIPATGKKVKVLMFDRVRFKDGKAIEHWGLTDDMGMMTQLGVVPEMG
jgi:predicted ester cyclase